MRLFDKVLSQGADELRGTAAAMAKQEGFAVLAADAIAEHYANTQKMEFGSDDYPYARPPWRLSFIEWNEPSRMWVEGEWQPNPSPGGQCGAFVISSFGDGIVAKSAAGVEELTGKRVDYDKSCTGVAVLLPCFYGVGRLWTLHAQTHLYMRDDGYIGTVRHFGAGLTELVQRIGEEATVRFCDSIVHIVAMTFTFANCANVKLIDSTSDLAPTPKIQRRLKLPGVRRYTLQIEGHATSRSSEPSGVEGVVPYHLCRGHFATYTADKPLFGNPKLVGRYWHPPHMKGKRANGEIVKDYAVVDKLPDCG